MGLTRTEQEGRKSRTPPIPQPGAPAARSGTSVWRIRQAAICAVFVAFAFNCDSGRLVPDTKLDLVADPAGFLARALHMWDPQGFAGQVQNQAYGYLFPMGPFFLLGKLAHLPMWAVQRLWWSALLCTAFLGVIALAQRLGIGSPAGRMIAGAAYALSPHLLSVLGPVSAEALPMCLTPWVLVPLVSAAREGSPRRAAMRSGIAVLCMGAINAALVLAALVPAALWLVTRRPDARMRRLTGAWVLAVALATSWWVLPLVLLGRYGADFLNRIESASTTTGTTTLVETLRGTSDWVGFLPTSGWHAAQLLLTRPALIVNSVVVVALGLVGLSLRRIPSRAWLLLCLYTGIAAISFAYVGSVHGLFATQGRSALDGTLAALRNVHKFDVVLRLPLVLGIAHLCGTVSWGAKPAERRLSRALVLAVAAGAVAGTATPLFALRVAPAGTFQAVPDYWKQTAQWLGAQHAQGRSLLLPGSRFGQYSWGTPLDEPMQPLAESEWDVRAAVPLATPGHVRMLDAVDQLLASGEPSDGLAAYLARGGVRYLVVRNDLDFVAAQVPRPLLVHEALAGSPGVSLAHSFGPLVGSDVGPEGAVFDQHLEPAYHAVEIWTVDARGDPRVRAVASAGSVEATGASESLLAMSDNGLQPDRPVVFAGDVVSGYTAGGSVLSDGMRRREADFGSSALDTSATLALDDPRRMAAVDRDFVPYPATSAQSYARYLGAASILASSSQSDPDAYGGSVHVDMPYSAFDGDPATAWRSNAASVGIGEWLRVAFTAARTVDSASMSMPADSMARQVRVTTERGSATTSVSGTGQQPLNVVAGQTRFLQVTVTAVRGPGPFHQVGITDVRIPGLSIERTVVMPSNAPAAGAVQQVLMSAPDDARNGCVVQAADVRCAVGQAQLGEETAGIDRTFSLPAAGRFAVGLTAVPRAGPQLDALIASVLGSDVSVSSSSRAIADPLAGPASVLDADRGTGWIASTSDPAPTVTIRWGRPLTMSSLVIKTASTLAATAPDTVVVTTPGGSRTARIGPDGTVSFAAVRTDRVSMVLTSSTGLRLDYDPVTHGYDHLGIGVSEIDVPGVATPARAATDATPVALPCGSGPDVVVDGVTRQTLVDATLADLRDLRRVAMTVCGGDQMPLSAGPHRVRAVSTSTWIPLRLSLAASAPAAPPAPVPTTVRHWGATNRSVGVGVRAGETLVVVDENANAGWHATFAGHRLQAITVDGWEQGFLLPAGAAGVMHLEYVPDRIYRLALLAGLLAVMLLVIGAFRGPRRIPRRAATLPPSAGWPGRVGLLTASLGFALLTAGWRGGAVWLVVGSAAVLNERGSWHRRRYLMPFLAGAAYLTAGLTLAVGHWGTTHYAATSSFVQLMTAAAVVATAWAPGPAGVSPPRAGDDRIAHPPDAATSSPDVPRIGT